MCKLLKYEANHTTMGARRAEGAPCVFSCIFEQFAYTPGNGIHQPFSYVSRRRPGGGVYIYMVSPLVAIYYLERPFGTSGRRILAARSNAGFVEALMAVQQHVHIANVAVAGILRDRGLCPFVRKDWILDGSLSLQKLVLLDLPRLRELGVEYCRYLRKSEDLALCYDVVQRQGGHILKVQSYCYRAVHFEHGGAEAVRAECRRNDVGTVGELIQGADLAVLSAAHQNVAKALLQWLRNAQRQGFENCSDNLDDSERVSQTLWKHLRAKRSGDWDPKDIRHHRVWA